MKSTAKLDNYNSLKEAFQHLENFEQYFQEEMPKDLDLKELEEQACKASIAQYKRDYDKVLNYLQRSIHISYFGEIVLPPVLVTSEALDLPLNDVQQMYDLMLRKGILLQETEYEYTLGAYFPLTDAIKQRIGSALTR